MSARRLVLFDLDGVLVESGSAHRLPGAAEVLAQLRVNSDTVLTVIASGNEEDSRRRVVEAGIDRYLDLDVGAYGVDTDDRAEAVALTRHTAEKSYDSEFMSVVVTAAKPGLVARARPEADTVIVVASSGVAEPTIEGADHVVARLVDAVAPVRST